MKERCHFCGHEDDEDQMTELTAVTASGAGYRCSTLYRCAACDVLYRLAHKADTAVGPTEEKSRLETGAPREAQS